MAENKCLFRFLLYGFLKSVFREIYCPNFRLLKQKDILKFVAKKNFNSQLLANLL